MELRDTSKTTLRRIYSEHPEILTNRSRLESLLKDHGYSTLQLTVLLQSFDEAIPRRIAKPNAGVPPEVNLAKLVLVLQQNRFLDRNAATWAVNSWAFAIGVEIPGGVTSGKIRVVPPPIPESVPPAVFNGAPFRPAHKITFHGDRLWKLVFGVFVASRLIKASPTTLAALNDLYADYSTLSWLAIAAVVTFTSFSRERRLNPFLNS